MPFSALANQIQSTVSDKLSAGASAAMGSISSIGGTLSSGASAAASAFNAFTGQAKNLLSAGNLSPAALKGAAAQQVKALDPTSNFKGIPPPAVAATPTAKQPQETMKPDKVGYHRFPLDIGDHFIQFAFSDFAKPNALVKDQKRDPVFIQLPLSPSMTESYQANYKTEQLGIAGSLADTTLQNFLKNDYKEGMTAGQAGKALGAEVNATIKKSGGEAVTALVAQVATAVAPGVAGAVSKALGATTNPNMAVLFENVSFRSHSFSFKLHPVNQKESQALRYIINTFRARMLPGKMGEFFLSYPNKCTITIHPAKVYPILECVLESMSVNYAPNGPAFFKGSKGNPVEVDIQLSFKEIALFTRDVAEMEVTGPDNPFDNGK